MSDFHSSNIILESLELAVLVVDQEGVLQQVNLAAETLFERSRRILIGQKLKRLIASPKLDECLRECLVNSARFTLREIALSDRAVLVDISLSPFNRHNPSNKSKSDPSVLLEISSVTRFKQFVKDKNQLERLHAFRLIMRGLAHEIKNPLSGIRGAAQLLHKEIQDESKQDLTGILIKEADRLTALVDRVMGSRQELKLETLNIHEVIEHVVHLVTVNAENTPDVQRFYDPTLPEIVADREQLIQAMLNIVGNAIEAQSDSVKPVIGLVTQYERAVTINQQNYRQALKIKIWDHGPGVPEEMRDTLFDPLITGRPDGLGLGLSITQEIVQRHKGAVSLENHNDRTCFTITLPYSGGPE